MQSQARLKDYMQQPPPSRHSSQPGPLGVDLLPVDRPAARIDVDLVNAEPPLAFPEVAAGPEEEDHRESEVYLEETFGVVEAAVDGADCDEELVRMLLVLMIIRD